MKRFKTKIVQLAFIERKTEPRRERRIDIERFGRDSDLTLVRQRRYRPHVVQSVGKLD